MVGYMSIDNLYHTKDCINTSPVLALLDVTKNFVVKIDASGYGIGLVLIQEGHPIISKALYPTYFLVYVCSRIISHSPGCT